MLIAKGDGSLVSNALQDHGPRAGARPQLFSDLSTVDYAQASAAAHVKEFAPSDVICHEGDPVQQISLLTAGLVKVTKVGINGVEVILRFGVPGDVLGAVDLFSTGKHCSTMRAFGSCRALVWEAPFFKGLVARFPALHQSMVRLLGKDLIELQNRFREVATERVESRVASQLLRLLEKIGRPVNGAVEIGLSREELAQMTGTTLYSVSRLLSAWETRGIVAPRRKAVTVFDVSSLRQISREPGVLKRPATA